jgi:BlaI family penicillinase repressor
MARPKHEHPTPGELEVLKILWEQGPSTVRQVWEVLNARRARHYMSTKSLLDVMTEKGLLARRREGRAFLYQASVTRESALGQILESLLGRVFEGSASALVAHLLDQAKPSAREMEEIRRTVEAYHKQQGAD